MKHIDLRLAVLVAMSLATTARAATLHHPEKPTYPYEKCYGIAKGGQNDCFTKNNSCAGAAPRDQQGDAWIYLPAGTCERISGGSLKPKSDDSSTPVRKET